MAALAAGMLYNVQVFSSENGSDISMTTVGKMAIANNENGGGGTCKAEVDCGGGKKVSCSGTKRCYAGSWYVECDGARGEC